MPWTNWTFQRTSNAVMVNLIHYSTAILQHFVLYSLSQNNSGLFKFYCVLATIWQHWSNPPFDTLKHVHTHFVRPSIQKVNIRSNTRLEKYGQDKLFRKVRPIERRSNFQRRARSRSIDAIITTEHGVRKCYCGILHVINSKGKISTSRISLLTMYLSSS
jgi:hypothetical protein